MYCHLFGLFLGFEPWKITHASDNFGKLYDFAVELIKRYIVESVINAIWNIAPVQWIISLR